MPMSRFTFVAAGLALALRATAPALALAEDAALILAQPLRAQPDLMAREDIVLARGTPVEVLERRGGWVRARAQDREGWLRLLALRETGPALPFAKNVAELFHASASAHPRVTAIAGFRGLPEGRPAAHALILGIGDYGAGIPRLEGASQDVYSAIMMARAMGIPEANILVRQDAGLSLAGLRAAMDALEARVLPNDEAFLYYSGHGTRVLLQDGRQARCAEALLSADGQVMADVELLQRLARLAAKARRVVVFIDADYATSSTALPPGVKGLRAKSWPRPGAADCDKAARLQAGILNAAQAGKGRLNLLHIAAAREGEAALDEPGRGGLASQAWLDCLSGGAQDTDASGGLSAQELADCAQPLIERLAAGHGAVAPQHLALSGITDMVLAPAEYGARGNALATLRDIHANRDDRHSVRLVPDRPVYRVGRDKVEFSLSSSHAGHVYLLMVDSEGKRFDLLFPNRKDDRNRILAGETLQLPRPGWSIRAGGPAGRNHLLALVSDTPRDFTGLGLKASGPFSLLSASPVAVRGIQFFAGASAHAASARCRETGTQRTLEAATACSDAYGADLISLEEVE